MTRPNNAAVPGPEERLGPESDPDNYSRYEVALATWGMITDRIGSYFGIPADEGGPAIMYDPSEDQLNYYFTRRLPLGQDSSIDAPTGASVVACGQINGDIRAVKWAIEILNRQADPNRRNWDSWTRAWQTLVAHTGNFSLWPSDAPDVRDAWAEQNRATCCEVEQPVPPDDSAEYTAGEYREYLTALQWDPVRALEELLVGINPSQPAK